MAYFPTISAVQTIQRRKITKPDVSSDGPFP